MAIPALLALSFCLASAPAPTAGFNWGPAASRSYLLLEKSALRYEALRPQLDQPFRRKLWVDARHAPLASLKSWSVDRSDDRARLTHAIPELSVGAMKKTEELETRAPGVGVQAHARMAWGERLTVTRKRQASGSPSEAARLVIQRVVSGTGDASDRAHYAAVSRTYVNRIELPQLGYALTRVPGGKDQTIGQPESKAELEVKLGQPFSLEATLEITDGIEPGPADHPQYIKDGSDGVTHRVTLSDPGLCLESASGAFRTGACE